ncbi:MAG: amidohydrolase, partial [Bacillota bacterium]
MSSTILIKDATIVSMDEKERVFEKQDILLKNGFIEAIDSSLNAEHKEDQVFSGTGKVVIPGLINAHNHAAMSLFRSYADDYPLMEWLEKKIFPAEAKLEPEDIYWGALLAMLEMIRGGTTTFVDMYFYMEQTAQACLESGMRAMLSQVFIGENAVPGFNSLEDVKSFTEQWDNAANGRINTILGPHAPYTCSPDFLKKVLKVTEDTRPLIHIHLSESRQEVEQSLKQYGKTPVAVLQDIGMFEREVLAAHCVHLTDEDIDILSNNKVGIAHNPGSNLKLGNGVAPLTRLLEHDALVGLGTDGPASNNNL